MSWAVPLAPSLFRWDSYYRRGQGVVVVNGKLLGPGLYVPDA
jgi:hypothetical protein